MKKLFIKILLALLFVILVYIFITPVGALRAKLILDGYAYNAFGSKIVNVTSDYIHDEDVHNGDVLYSIDPPPYDIGNGGYVFWIARKNNDVFYTAEYLGWG
ncbi:MAG: hypothetical protein P4M02_11850 [Clostridia bacterium]|nr:hypothetical protein [Clostridia bacterium]